MPHSTRLRNSIMKLLILALAASPLSFAATVYGRTRRAKQAESERQALIAKIRRFEPTVITASSAQLSQSDKLALKKIIQAAQLFDPLFLQQVWSGNSSLKKKLEADNSALGKLRLH